MGYRRPPLPDPDLPGPDGEPVPYGRRWAGAPDEAAYGVVLHPERFAPLGAVADALVAHLVRTYDVTVTAVDPSADDVRGVDVARAVRMTPASDDGAPVLLVWTTFPGLVGRVGAATAVQVPVCGCDACDDAVDTLAGDLESLLLGAAEGRLTETVHGPTLTTRLDRPDGWSESVLDLADPSWVPGTVDHALVDHLRSLPHGWQPWTRRAPPP